MVPLTVHLCLAWGAVSRRLWGYGIKDAMVTGAMIALVAQILIVVGTAASFVLSVETAFNSPMAIVNELREVSFGEAMVARTVGVVINSAIGAVAGLIGSALGGLVPGRAGAGS